MDTAGIGTVSKVISERLSDSGRRVVEIEFHGCEELYSSLRLPSEHLRVGDRVRLVGMLFSPEMLRSDNMIAALAQADSI